MSKAGLPGNPYDMPMEERMKLYREKYGRGLGESQARNGPKKVREASRRCRETAAIRVRVAELRRKEHRGEKGKITGRSHESSRDASAGAEASSAGTRDQAQRYGQPHPRRTPEGKG